MFFFRQSNAEKRVDELDRVMRASFQKARQDADLAWQWVQYLNGQMGQLRQMNSHMVLQVRKAMESKEIIKNEVMASLEKHNLFEKVKEEINVVKNRLEIIENLKLRMRNIEENNRPWEEKLYEIESKVRSLNEKIGKDKQENEEIRKEIGILREKVNEAKKQPWKQEEEVIRLRQEPEPRRTAREKFVRRLSRHSKDYIKGLIASLVVKYGKITALQIREIIVEEQGLCSKSSFYRVLEELEKEEKVHVVSSGKEKVYFVHGQEKQAEYGV